MRRTCELLAARESALRPPSLVTRLTCQPNVEEENAYDWFTGWMGQAQVRL